MAAVWRFYANEEAAWHWQKLDTTGQLLSQSSAGQSTYLLCLQDAMSHGYLYEPSQAKITVAISHYTERARQQTARREARVRLLSRDW